MSFILDDHPEIRKAELTGYPSWNQPVEIYCDECDRNITDEEQYEDDNHDNLCVDCLLHLHLKE